MRLTVHTIPHSTNAERVALAAAHKGFQIDWVVHDPGERAAIREISGQDLVPVAVFEDGSVLADSPEILACLEALEPEPPLWPTDPARRAEADIFIQWFNRVWKVPPNAIADRLASGTVDEAATAADRLALRVWLAWFEALLEDRDHLLGDEFGIADVVAFPFLKFAAPQGEDDGDPFHAVLSTEIALGREHPRLRAWIARVDARPRA